MPVAINLTVPAGDTFDPAEIEDAFARYFRGVQNGTYEDSDTIRFAVQSADPNVPNAHYDVVPIMYVGYEGSYPDVEELRVEEEEAGE